MKPKNTPAPAGVFCKVYTSVNSLGHDVQVWLVGGSTIVHYCGLIGIAPQQEDIRKQTSGLMAPPTRA